MLYAILKLIYRIGLWVFFRKVEVRNKEAIPEQGPLLLVANHPNTFMDPVVVASLLTQPAFFLAKSTVFGSAITNWMLRHMHLIPIHRREDTPEQPVNNEDAFAASFQALAAGKAIIIFPEGNSFNERRLRKIKTGTARIALGAEMNTNAGVRIIPIGLNYSDPTRFRSRIFVNVGDPIAVAEFVPSYLQDPTATVLALTEHIRVSLESLIIHTPSDDDDELAQQINIIYKDKLQLENTPAVPDQEQEFLRIKAIVKSIDFFRQAAPERVAAVREKIRVYMEQLEHLKLRDGVLVKEDKDLTQQAVMASLYVVVGFPVYLYGLLHNYLPYIIPSVIARRLTREEEWHAPIMLTVGIFSFPLFYALAAWLFWQFTPSVLGCGIYLLSLVISGFFSLSYWYTWHYIKEHWLLLRLFSKSGNLVHKLRLMRREIILELEGAQQEYQQQLNAQHEEVK